MTFRMDELMQKELSALFIRTKINKIHIHAKLFAQKSSTYLLFHLFSLLIYDFLRVWLILIKHTRLETIFWNPHSKLLRFYARLFQYFFDSALWLCLLKTVIREPVVRQRPCTKLFSLLAVQCMQTKPPSFLLTPLTYIPIWTWLHLLEYFYSSRFYKIISEHVK